MFLVLSGLWGWTSIDLFQLFPDWKSHVVSFITALVSAWSRFWKAWQKEFLINSGEGVMDKSTLRYSKCVWALVFVLHSRGTGYKSYGRKRVSVAWKCSLPSKEVLRIVCAPVRPPEPPGTRSLRFPTLPWHLCSEQAWARGREFVPKPPQRAIFCPRNGLPLPCIHLNLGAFRSSELAQISPNWPTSPWN